MSATESATSIKQDALISIQESKKKLKDCPRNGDTAHFFSPFFYEPQGLFTGKLESGKLIFKVFTRYSFAEKCFKSATLLDIIMDSKVSKRRVKNILKTHQCSAFFVSNISSHTLYKIASKNLSFLVHFLGIL